MGRRALDLSEKIFGGLKVVTRPENCRWASIEEQNNNRSKYNVVVEWEGELKTVSQVAKQYGYDPGVIFSRLRNGWTLEESLTVPVRAKK